VLREQDLLQRVGELQRGAIGVRVRRRAPPLALIRSDCSVGVLADQRVVDDVR